MKKIIFLLLALLLLTACGKQAAEKLAAMGYTRIYEFGGINPRPGDIITTEEETN